MRILPMGLRAILVESPPGDPAEWGLALRAMQLDGVIDVVPAARTVLVSCTEAHHVAVVVDRLNEVQADIGAAMVGEPVVIPTRYDGPDLAEVAASAGLTVDGVIDLHASSVYHVAFCGFAPGFGYLRGLPAALHLPRRATPRPRVPAGSVAIAAEYTAVYPTVSPGGWHLIGITDRPMFDVHSEPPALLQPGTTVRFEPR